MVTVLFFAQLREQLQCEKIVVDISQPLTVAELRDQIVRMHLGWSQFLLNEKLLFAVNQRIAKSTELVNLADEVAFFPPVTGG